MALALHIPLTCRLSLAAYPLPCGPVFGRGFT